MKNGFFALTLLAASTAFPAPALAADDDAKAGHLWADELPAEEKEGTAPVYTMTDTDHSYCHETPEPATWLLAAGAVVGVVGWNVMRRRVGA